MRFSNSILTAVNNAAVETLPIDHAHPRLKYVTATIEQNFVAKQSIESTCYVYH